MTRRLDPEEALSGPLYFVAAMLVIVPLADFFLTVPPAEFASRQWRFATLGLLSGHTLLIVLGAAMALAMSAMLKRYDLQKALVIACLTSAAIFALLTVQFWVDMGNERIATPPAEAPAVISASNRAIIRLLLTTVAFGYLGWRARRMIPPPTRHKTPKPVHVVSK